MNTGEIVATCAIYAACRINQLRKPSSAPSHSLRNDASLEQAIDCEF